MTTVNSNTSALTQAFSKVESNFANFNKPTAYEYREGDKPTALKGKDGMNQFVNDLFAGSRRWA